MKKSNSMKILFLTDPILSLKPQTDTSLGLMRVARLKNQDCFFACADDVFWNATEAAVKSFRVLTPGDRHQQPRLASEGVTAMTDFDLIFVRKDPPFDDSYLRLCWFLAAFEDRVRFSNRPSLLLRYHEKMLPLEGAAQGIFDSEDFVLSCISKSEQEIRSFVESIDSQEIIVKPWLGHGGRDVQLFKKDHLLENLSSILSGTEEVIVQAFQSEVQVTGDRRVFFIGGRHVGDFVRMPQKGRFVSNIAQGGRALLTPMNEAELRLTKKIEFFLSKLKIDFAGADFIGSRVNEINITSPTGFLTYEDISQINLCETYFDYLEGELK